MTASRHDIARNEECPLLDKLPAELRNHIYRLALVREASVIVYPTRLAEPGLLTVSKQVRQAARPIFYHENTFCLHVSYYNHGATALLTRKMSSATEQPPVSVANVTTWGDMQPNWNGPIRWMKAYLEGTTEFALAYPSPAVHMQRGIVAQMLATMNQTVWLLGPRRWEEVEVLLLRYRPMLAFLEPGWDD